MSRLVIAVLAIAVGLAVTAVPAAAIVFPVDPSLDSTFGTGGRVLTSVGSGAAGTSVRDLLVQPDHKIVVVGTAESGGPKMVLARYLPSGQLDPDFNGGNPVLATFGNGGDTDGIGVVRLSNGNLVVAGQALDQGHTTVFLAAYQPNGAPDTSFGGTGSVLDSATTGTTNVDVHGLIADDAGGLLVVGGWGTGAAAKAFVVRHLVTGALDTQHFGDVAGSGVDFVDLTSLGASAHGYGLVQSGPGTFALTGFATDTATGHNLALISTIPGGTLHARVASFGNGNDTVGRAVTIQNGKLVVAGSLHDQGVQKAFVARFGADDSGTVDPTFAGGAGVTFTDYGGTHPEQFNSIDVGTDGSLVAAGSDAGDFLAVQLTKDGAAAPSLTTGGTGPNVSITAIGDGGTASAAAVARKGRGYVVTTAGRALDGGLTKLALVQYGSHPLPVPEFSVSYDNHGFPSRAARPGQVVTFDPSSSSDPAALALVKYEWDLDGNGTYDVQTGAPDKQTHAYAAPGSVVLGGVPGLHMVRLRVTNSDGLTAAVEHTFRVLPNNPPVPHLGNGVALLPPLIVNVPSTISAAASTDDGGIVDYHWDLDGNGSFEKGTGGTAAVTTTFRHTGDHTIHLKVTDDDGASTVGKFTLKVIKPPCVTGGTTLGRARITEAAGTDPKNTTTCFHLKSTTTKSGTTTTTFASEAAVTVNGITVSPLTSNGKLGETNEVIITEKSTDKGKLTGLTLASKNAEVTGVAHNAPVRFETGKIKWDMTGGTIAGFHTTSSATVGGLSVDVNKDGKSPPTLNHDDTTSTMLMVPHLPSSMTPPGAAAGATPAKPMSVTFGGAHASAAQAFDFTVGDPQASGADGMPLGPVILNYAHIYYAPLADGNDLWGVEAHVSVLDVAEVKGGMEMLQQPACSSTVPTPCGGGMQLHAAYLSGDFGSSGINVGVFALKSISFQINLGPGFTKSQLHPPDTILSHGAPGGTCVPYVGKVDLFTGRQWKGAHKPEGAYVAALYDPSASPAIDRTISANFRLLNSLARVHYPHPSSPEIGYAEMLQKLLPHPNVFDNPSIPSQYYANTPDIVDYHTPDVAVCGQIGFSILQVIDGKLALGYAHYASGESIVFFKGTATILGLVNADIAGEVWSDGYVHFSASVNANFMDWLILDAGFDFERYQSAFNAEAYANVTIKPLGFSAGADVLASSAGMAVCLQMKFFGNSWTPGAGMKWGHGPDFYFSGCDVGPYRAAISHKSLFSRDIATGNTAVSHKFTVPAGLPGTTLEIIGQSAPPHVILTDPHGHTFDTGAGLDPVQDPSGFAVAFKNHLKPVTEVALRKPVGGAWTMTTAADSAPIAAVQQADGLPRPKITAQITGSGPTRTLHYNVSRLPAGEHVTFSEDGAHGGTMIGQAQAKATTAAQIKSGTVTSTKGTIPYTPGIGLSEQRPIDAMVLDSNGIPRERIKVTHYHAPPPPAPTKIGKLSFQRSGGVLNVTWKKPAGPTDASHYSVAVYLNDGRVLFFSSKTGHVTIPGVRSGTTVKVMARPVSTHSVVGPIATKVTTVGP